MHNESGEGLIEQIRQDLNSRHIFPVHRLDKPTSGLLLCAKNTQANSVLSQLFEQRKVEKYYLALSKAKPKKKQGLILGDMLRTRNGNWKLSKTQDNPAVTQFFSYGISGDSTKKGQRVFILKPYTGKTHQLRVALKSLGSPISGDPRYSGASDAEPRMHLHAYCLCFSYQAIDYQFKSLPSGGEFTDETIELIETELNEPWTLAWPKLPKRFV